MNKKNGLALITALMATTLLCGSVLILATFCAQSDAEADAFARRFRLRAAAEAAARRGLAELQLVAGPDARHTYVDAAALLQVGGASENSRPEGRALVDGVRWRWTIKDLSAVRDRAASAQAWIGASAWARSDLARPKLPRALFGSLTLAQRRALAFGAPDFFGDGTASGAWQTRGLLTDAARGGWRADLSEPSKLDGLLGPPISEILLSEAWRRPPGRGLPLLRRTEALRDLSTAPLLTDLRVSLGFFNSRHDGRHRLRFHGSGLLWNPLVVPVLAGPQGRVCLVEISGAPEITVTNLDSGAEFVVDLDECPQADFGAVRQGPRERGLWFWAEVADPPGEGMTARGLLPGAAYAFVNPTPEAQPQGLARILSTETWRLDNGASTLVRRSDDERFRPTDRIEIVGRFRRPVSVRLRAYAGEPDRSAPIADYPGAILISWDNVRFEDFRIRTTGADYSREDSSGYRIGERRACLRLRLRPRGWEDFAESAGAGRFFRERWDLARPEDAAEWSVDPPVLSALDVVDHDASSLAGLLWDRRANRHAAAEPGAFASWRLRDLPTWPLVSVGALRHLEPTDSGRWTEALDRYYLSAPLAVPEDGVASHQPYLWLADPTAAEPAARWRIIGPWNVNASDPREWEAFFADAIGSWRAESGGASGNLTAGGAWFFTRPSGAALPAWGSATSFDLGDQIVATLPEEARLAVFANQSARRLSASQLRTWAEQIVALQPACGWPYPSLEAFARSALLTRSLEAARLNDLAGGSPSGLPFRLAAGDLLEAWAPVLTVRGDTFQVVGLAEGLGGSATCELLVQREPTELQPRCLGRRFRIISTRFRNP